MVHSNNVKRLLAGVTSALMLLAALPALAQETTEAAANATSATQAPPGGGLLFLLIGLGAILLVAVIWLVRERTEVNTETVSQ